MRLILLLLASCYHAPPQAPERREEPTYMMITPGIGQCTAWGIDDSHVITAGHCCHEEGEYTLISSFHRHVKATVVRFLDEDYEDRTPTDVCLMRTYSPVQHMSLATEMPQIDAPMAFVGYPRGEWVHSTGFYIGDVDGPFQNWNNYAFTAPCDKGASGSAVFTDAGVFGVLVRLGFTGEDVLPGAMGCIASPLSQIVEILD